MFYNMFFDLIVFQRNDVIRRVSNGRKRTLEPQNQLMLAKVFIFAPQYIPDPNWS